MATIEIENRTRSVWHFPVYNKAGKEVERLVIGDSLDANVEGERNHVLQPDPRMKITAEQWKALGKPNQTTILALEASGDLTIRGLPEGLRPKAA